VLISPPCPFHASNQARQQGSRNNMCGWNLSPIEI
jgi:hypothetical protein